MTHHDGRSKPKIHDIQTTPDTLSSRSGLSLIPPYLEKVGLLDRLERTFGSIRKINRGITIREAFKQMICFFIDGTNFHLTRFDELAQQEGYRKTIQTPPDQMASSHQIKRFLRSFSFVRNFHFRSVLQDLFLWRINQKQPDLIKLDIDTMVMDNDQARKREGVDTTYKGVRGFQPVFLKYNGTIVDALLRRGSKHSNNGDTAAKMIEHVVEQIRSSYCSEVPILVTGDSGFYDGTIFRRLEEVEIGYVIGGRLEEVKEEFTRAFPEKEWKPVNKENGATYEGMEFAWRCENWEKSRRMILTRRIHDGNQKQLSFARKRNVLVTNLGMGESIDQALQKIGDPKCSIGEVIRLSHTRGEEERTHRCLKEFGTEQLPMLPFEANNAFFNIMVLSFNICEAFQEDIVPERVLSSSCMPNTFRRTFLDVAGKVVETGRYTILRVTEAIYDRLCLDEIWETVNSPPVPAIC